MGLVDKGGAWLTYGEHKWQGRDKAKLALQKDMNIWHDLEKNIRSVVSGEVFEVSGEVETTDGDVKNDKPVSKKRVSKSEGSSA